MTKEQYKRLASPFLKHKSLARLLICVDQGITALVFLSYPILLCALLLRADYGKLVSCIWVPGLSFAAVSLFRRCYSAKRPYEVWDIQPLIEKDTKGKSFPSRHIFSVYMIGMTYYFVLRPVGILIGILGIVMAYARVAGGVHFPRDVAVGALAGILCGLAYCVLGG